MPGLAVGLPRLAVTAAKLCGFIVDRMNAFKQTIAACGAAAAAAAGIGRAITPTRQQVGKNRRLWQEIG